MTSAEFDNLNTTLEQEVKELDQIQMTMSTGSRLMREREDKLRQLESALADDMVSRVDVLPIY